MASSDEREKPSKRETSRQDDIGLRTRTHARTLLARLYLSDGAAMLVRDAPYYDVLGPCLTKLDEDKPHNVLDRCHSDRGDGQPLGIPTPAELGFSNSDIIPLNRGGLASRARSVQRWRNWIEKRMAGRTSAAELRELKVEARELESLGERVAVLHGIIGQKSTSNSPFWLEPRVEELFQSLITHELDGLHVPDEVPELARLICWIVGLPAAERFIKSARDGLLTTSEYQHLLAIKRFSKTLRDIQELRNSLKEAATEQTRQEHVDFWKQLEEESVFQDLRTLFAALPMEVQKQSQIEISNNNEKVDLREMGRHSRRLNSRLPRPLALKLSEGELLRIEENVLAFRALLDKTIGRLDQIEAAALQREMNIQAAFRASVREKGLFDRLRECFATLPVVAISTEWIFLPARDRDIDLELTRERTEKTINAWPQPPSNRTLRWLALICLTDQSTAPIPWEVFQKRVEQYELRWFWEDRWEPGFGRVIEVIGSIDEDWSLEEARKFLISGGSLEDMSWFTEQKIDRDNALYGLAAKPFRVVVNWLCKHNAEVSDEDLESFWKSVASESGQSLVESLARFLGGMVRPSKQQVGEITGLVRTLSHPALHKRLIDRLQSWSNPPARSRLPAGCPENLPAEVTTEVRRLAYYQRMAGQTARIPGSIRSLLEARSRQNAELEHLSSLGDQATPFQRSRLEHLSKRIGQSEDLDAGSIGRMLRQIRQVCMLTAVSAAQQIIRDDIRQWWISKLGIEPEISRYRWQDQLKLISWVEGLELNSKEAVIGILQAHQKHGAGYRRVLPQNAGWLDQAQKSIQLDAWLAPPTARLEMDGQQITMGVASHPVDVFLMGSRFDTCLDLHDGGNREAVIANAADANKAVIYAWRADGMPIARKLVGVQPDWKLVGFRVYAHEHSEALDRAFASYCGTWAAKAGLGLAKAGVPDRLSGGFWYNDGTHAWSEDAISAYREIHPEANLEIEKNSSSATLVRLQQALGMVRQDKPGAMAKLETIGQQWPVSAAYWWIRVDGDSSAETAFPRYINDSPRYLRYHLTPAGIAQKLIQPGRLNLMPETVLYFWSELAWTMLALAPPQHDDLQRVADVMIHLPSNPDGDSVGSACFATCRVSPALGTLPFRKLIRLLRSYSDFFVKPHCGCNEDQWEMWARVLRQAWIRQPDPAAFADAFADPAPIVSQVMDLFCRICPDRRFSGPIRRQLRTMTEKNRQTTLLELRTMVQAIAQEPVDEQSKAGPEAVALNPDINFDVRYRALIQLLDQTDADVNLGASLCAEWTQAELAQLPMEIRQSFARGLVFGEFWATWPGLYWLATLPDQEQCEMLHAGFENQTRTIDLAGVDQYDDYLTVPGVYAQHTWCVIVHALEHADESIRRAAEMFFRVAVQSKPDALDDLLALAGPWIWPETYQRLNRILQDANS